MNQSLRLTIVEPNSHGGLIHYAYQLCTALAGKGLDVELITGSDYELSEYPHNFHVNNILNLWELFDPKSMENPPNNKIRQVVRKILWTLRRVTRAFRLVREWVRLTLYLLRTKPDIVQFGKINFPFEALFLRYLTCRGLILTQICHEFERRESTGALASLLDKTYATVFNNFSIIFFHAEENRGRFLSLFKDFPQSRTALIPHGNEGLFLSVLRGHTQRIDLYQRYSLKEDEPVVLFFGILSPSKGIEDLIDAFSIVYQHCRSKLVIAGYPSKFINVNQLREQVENHHIEEAVTFDTRYIPNDEVGLLMEMASVVVFPYRSSTQSGALQVAFSFGKPVIVTNVGGLPEIVEDGKSGFVIPSQDPFELARKILELLQDQDLARNMGAYAKHLSETVFGWTQVAEIIIRKYQEIHLQDQSNFKAS